jgi:serine/threonine protein kinase
MAITMTTQLINNRYQLQQLIGENANRQTWLATNINNQQEVVVKLLAFNPVMAWEELKLFEREAKTLQRLDHPYIPKYLDYFYLDHLPNSRLAWFGLVQSRIEGKSLQQLLDDGRHFSVDQVEQIATQTLNILVYLHDLQPPVLHRDIKPSNLIWGNDEHIYLVDFGAVQDSAAIEGMTFTVVGTYGYVPMEQFGGKAEPASDLYALGATLIHLLTGIAPADLPQQDARLQFADRVSLEPGLVNWLTKMVEPQLSQRLGDAKTALTTLYDRQALATPINTRQPVNSKIKLQELANKLAIKIPSKSIKDIKPRLVYYGLFVLTQAIPCAGHILSNSDSKVFYTTLLMLQVLFFALLCIPSIKGQATLQFSRHDFEISWQIFGITYWRRQGKITTIKRIIDSQYSYWNNGSKISDGIAIELTNGQKYVTNSMPMSERLWLKQEIDDWLMQD